MSQTNYSSFKYIPDEIDEKTFLDKFVIRVDIFEDIFADIKESDYSIANQDYIIIGQRGQGKTSLLRKIQLAVKSDEKLSSFLLPIKFTEEQYQIRSLCRLWEVIAEELEDSYEDYFKDILDSLESHLDDDDYELRCFEYLESRIKKEGKKILLLIDNIDELLGKLKDKEQRHLREILLTSSTFRIIGGSTKMLEQQYDYSKPFYEFFKIIRLGGLDTEESIKFLKTIAKDDEEEKINAIIQHTPERIESLRQLTGGVPRTLVMLYDVFIQDNTNAFDDLLKVLNNVTPLYKDRMDSLPTILQDIVHNIAMNWDGITTKELAKKTRLESKSVSSQLKQLEKYQIIEFEKIGKNKIYKIQERFFNIWYLMRFGRKRERNKVEWLVKFLLAWYSPKELNSRATKFIDSVNSNQELNESYVYYMSEALSYSGLEIHTEYEMKASVSKYLCDKKSSFKDEMSKSDVEVLSKALNLNNDGKRKEAIELLVKSQKTSIHILASLGSLYDLEDNYEKAELYYLEAIENGKNDLLNNLSRLYYKNARNIEIALRLSEQSYSEKHNYFNTFILSSVYLWAEKFQKSYEKFSEWLAYSEALESYNYVIEYFLLLLAKGQYYKAKEFLELEKYQLKDRYKSIWYVLMTLMQDEFPHEIKKMGSELGQSVDEILEDIAMLKVKYE